MKQLMLILTAALTALATRAALPQPDLIAQIHFAGGGKVSADKNFHVFANEFTSPEALALRKQTADKLAPWLAGWLQASLGTTVPGGAAKLRPLLDDLQTAEWFLEARAAAGKPDVAIAIKLDAAKAQLWQASLKPFFPAATFKQSAGWLIFDSGTGAVKPGDSLAQKISAPATGWATADINWPLLGQWFPALQKLDLPETTFQVSADATELAINGKFLFPQNLTCRLDPWQFPSNTVHEPFTSFTAARGFAGWLNGQDWAQAVKLSPPANQMFSWALEGVPLQSLTAIPVANATAALRQLGAGLQPVVAELNANGGFFPMLTLEVTNTGITLTGAQLFQSLATPNLAFYHWEITAERQSDQLNLAQLSLMLTRHHQLDVNSAGYKWITKTGPALGNTITVITQTAPDQMTFKRTAPGGLTAFEFIALANWLEASDFPHCNLSLAPFTSERLKKLREANKNRPAQPAPGH
ncbi:MAG: hypothetical protein JF609_04025 [Verrucomicrobia bacterium]|nr:hypothetical protein [Verrucomicrobiota bacterium]